MSTIADVMTPDPVVVSADAALVACAQELLSGGFRQLPVVDERGGLIGMLSDRRLFSVGALTGREAAWIFLAAGERRTTAGQLAEPARVVARADVRLIPVLKRMIDLRSDVAVVVDHERRPRGIFTEHDGLRLAAERIPADLEVIHELSRPAATVGARDIVSDALFALTRDGGRHVVVVDPRGRAVGVISHRDIVEQRRTLNIDTVLGGLIRGPLVTLAPDASLADAARLMLHHGIGCLPILDAERRPRRVITRADLLSAVVAVTAQAELFARP